MIKKHIQKYYGKPLIKRWTKGEFFTITKDDLDKEIQ